MSTPCGDPISIAWVQPPPESPPARARRPVWPIVVGGAAIVGLLVGGLMRLDRPDAVKVASGPTGLTATARTCAPPQCDRIASTITLAWNAPADPAFTGFRVLRDGAPVPGVSALPASAAGFTDQGVTAGSTHDYAVVATGPGGDSAPSDAATVVAPLPPLPAAQLVGIYDVTLVVQSATNLTSLSDIPSPKPGEHRTSTWGFQPLCAPNEGACATGWTGRSGMLRAGGGVWSGRVFGPPARCADGTFETSPIDIRIRARSGAMIGGAWSVTSFAGLYSVSFHCPGFLVSRGTVAVTGTHR
jgi:hypothetical protein